MRATLADWVLSLQGLPEAAGQVTHLLGLLVTQALGSGREDGEQEPAVLGYVQ